MRQREADLALLREALDLEVSARQEMEGFVRQREADLALLREALDLEVSARQEMEGFVRQREADLALLRDAFELEASTRQHEVALLQSQLKQSYDALAEAQQQTAERETELATIYASRSWRYTRILRRQ